MNNEQQAYVWLQGIIFSCETRFHFICGRALIDLFHKKFPEDKIKKDLLLDQIGDRFHLMFPEEKTK